MARTKFQQQVSPRLAKLAKRLRVDRALAGVGAVAVATMLVLSVQFLLDYWLRLRIDMRGALLVVVVGVLAVTVWRAIVQPMRLRFDERDIAQVLEGKFPQLNSVLISAVDFDSGNLGSQDSNSRELADSVIAQAIDASDGLPMDAVIQPKSARHGVIKMVAVLVVAVGSFGFAPQNMGIWLDRNILLRDVSWPKRTLIVVDAPKDGIIRGAIGDDLEIRASIAEGSVVPRRVEVHYETESGKTGRETMTGVGRRGFRFTFARAKEEVRFFISGGDDATGWFKTRLSDRPRIEEATLTVEPPAYTGIAPYSLPSGQRACEVHLGGIVSIHAIASKSLASARLMNGTEMVEDLVPQDREINASVEPTESRTYHFELTDLDGLANVRPTRLSVRLLKDTPPQVKLLFADVGNMVTKNAVIPVEVNMQDDLGLADAQLMYRIDTADAVLQSLELPEFKIRSQQFSSRFDWPVESTGAAVGEQVATFAQAADFNDVSGPGIGESTTITFRVVTPEELLAELNRREQEYRRQFERAVDSQERLRRRLLTVLSHMNETVSKEDLELQLAPLERRQRQIIAQVNVLRQQFAQVLSSLAINQLDDPDIRERLAQGIIDPLTELGNRDLSQAADQIRQLTREQTMAVAQQIDPQQERVIREMRRVLDHMLKWEGFQQTVTLLREIMRLQKELNVETRSEIEQQSDDVFED